MRSIMFFICIKIIIKWPKKILNYLEMKQSKKKKITHSNDLIRFENVEECLTTHSRENNKQMTERKIDLFVYRGGLRNPQN